MPDGATQGRAHPLAASRYLVGQKEQELRQRSRKLLGTFVLIALVVVYSLVATAIATARLADASPWVHLVYFLFSGLLWVLPAMLVIRWMLRPDSEEKRR